jgi:hypothetical protein
VVGAQLLIEANQVFIFNKNTPYHQKHLKQNTPNSPKQFPQELLLMNSMQTPNDTSKKYAKPYSRMLIPHLLYRTDLGSLSNVILTFIRIILPNPIV